MTDDRDRPAERTSLDGPADEPWPPPEWREQERIERQARDPEQGRHLIWVLLAAAIFFVAWYAG